VHVHTLVALADLILLVDLQFRQLPPLDRVVPSILFVLFAPRPLIEMFQSMLISLSAVSVGGAWFRGGHWFGNS
jgi:hypothetical protein